MTGSSKYVFNNCTIGSVVDTLLGNQVNEISVNANTDLSKVETQIQELLNQRQKNGDTPENARQKVANDLASDLKTQAEKDPTVKNKLERWAKYLGNAAGSGVIGEATVEALKLALRLLGIPVA